MLRYQAPIHLVRHSLSQAFPESSWPFNVAVEHFIDAGERDAAGEYDYYYEGDVYTFDDGAERLKLRTYIESPTVASTLGLTSAALRWSTLAKGASRYLAARGITVIRALGPNGTYERWEPEEPA